MYIDEIKKLLKDIEKSIQGDRRWIEKGDHKIREKMELILEKNSESKQYPQEPILIPNEFILPQFQKKNNIVSGLNNFIDNQKTNKNIIKLPRTLIDKNNIEEEKKIIDFEIKDGMTFELKAHDINGKNIKNNGKLIISNLSDIENANLSNIDGKVEIVIDNDTDFNGILPNGSTIEIKKGHTLKLTKEQAKRVKIIGEGNVVIKDATSPFDLQDLNIDRNKIKVNKNFLSKDEISRIPKSETINVPEGETLYISAEDADGRKITGRGNVVITNLDSNLNADLSQISTDGGTFIDPNNLEKFKGKINLSSKINNNDFDKLMNSKMKDNFTNSQFDSDMRALVKKHKDEIKEQNTKWENDYELLIVKHNEENDKLTAEHTADKNELTQKFDSSVSNSQELQKLLDKQKTDIAKNMEKHAKELDKMKRSYDLKLATMKQIHDKEITDMKNIDDINDSKIKKSLVLSSGQVKRLTAKEADGMIITGDGKVIITDLESNPDADLSGINPRDGSTIDVQGNQTFNGKINPNTKINLGKDSNLIIPADKVNGLEVIGQGNINVTDLKDNTNLDGLKNSGTKTIQVNENTNFKNKLPKDSVVQVSEGRKLKLSAEQANGNTISGNGNVEITDLDKMRDADLSKIINSGKKTLKINEDTDFIGTLPKDCTLEVNNDKKLTLTAKQASGNSIIGNGGVEITDLNSNPDADLSEIKNTGDKKIKIDEDTTIRGKLPNGCTLEVKDGKKLTLPAKQADGNTINGIGNVEITDLDKKENADLSKVKNTGDKNIKIDKDTNFNGTLPDNYSVIGNPDVSFKNNGIDIKIKQQPTIASLNKKYNVNLDELAKSINILGEQVDSALGSNQDIISGLMNIAST